MRHKRSAAGELPEYTGHTSTGAKYTDLLGQQWEQIKTSLFHQKLSLAHKSTVVMAAVQKWGFKLSNIHPSHMM